MASNRQTIGPSLPPGFSISQSTNSNDSSSPSVMIGPQILIPSSRESSSPDRDSPSPDQSHTPVADRASFGPALPPGFKQDTASISDDDDSIIGPKLGEINQTDSSCVADEIERRAQQMHQRLQGASDHNTEQLEREEWMMELPPALSKSIGLGLSARNFRKREMDSSSDRSTWTDTPADKEKKLQEGSSDSKKARPDQEMFTKLRDEQSKTAIVKHDKEKRKESLLEKHEKKRKKEKKEKKKHREDKEETSSRRPFDRDADLKVNQFDEAQRKTLIHKSRALNTRFSQGQYL